MKRSRRSGPSGVVICGLHAVEAEIKHRPASVQELWVSSRARREVVDWLRQRSRPYLFSNTLCPMIAATSLKVLDLLEESAELRQRLMANADHFRRGLTALGFTLVPGQHPIIPVMLGEARLAQDMAARLLDRGIYVIGFSFPVVPKGQARIRTQMSAAHSRDQLDRALEAFAAVGRELGVIE